MIAGPERPPTGTASPRAQPRRRRSPAPARRRSSVNPCAPARTHDRAVSTRPGRSGGELHEDRHARHPRDRPDDLDQALRRREERLALVLVVRARQVHLERDDAVLEVDRAGDVMYSSRATRRRRRPPGPRRDSRGRSSATNARTPGFCSPTAVSRPDAVSAARGVGQPLDGANVRLRVTTPPSRCRSTRPGTSPPVPRHPDAASTGCANRSPPRSTSSEGFVRRPSAGGRWAVPRPSVIPATSRRRGSPRAASARAAARRRATGPTGSAPG